MRITLHAVSAADYRALLPALLPMFRASGALRRGAPSRRERQGASRLRPRRSRKRRAEASRCVTSWPASPAQGHSRRRSGGGYTTVELPLVHVPEAVGWSFSRRPLITTAAPSFDDRVSSMADGVDIERARQHVVRRYLGAFGPAWTSRPVRRGPGPRRATSGRPSPRSTTRARWSAFATRPGASCWTCRTRHDPGEEAVALPRLLPMWDEILLGTRDRTRVISDEDRARVISRNGDVLPTFLVDGRVGGFWWPSRTARRHGSRSSRSVALPRPPGARSRPRPTGSPAWLGPLEPAVYARYRTSGARRL